AATATGRPDIGRRTMTMQDSDIRTLLDAVDVPAPKIDLGEAMRQGSRVRRRRRIGELTGVGATSLAVGAAILLTFAAHPFSSAGTGPAGGVRSSPPAVRSAPAAPAAPVVTTCSVSALALPPGIKDYRAEAIDSTGRYVVGWANSNTIY